jgi:hypothetical protein
VVPSKYKVGDTVRKEDITGGSECKRAFKDRSVAIVKMLRTWRARERDLISGRGKIYLFSLNSTELQFCLLFGMSVELGLLH